MGEKASQELQNLNFNLNADYGMHVRELSKPGERNSWREKEEQSLGLTQDKDSLVIDEEPNRTRAYC